jgi:catechol 2,3-dioxygenase-like lactoylglutathione lyase family enzyme
MRSYGEQMTIPARLSLVTLGARDVTRLRDFYAGLGWKPVTEVPGQYVSFLLGGVMLAMYGLEALAEESLGEGEVGDWRGVTLALNVDSRDEVDAVWRRMVERGAAPTADPVDRPWGGRSGYVADPEGNRWEVAWAPDLEFDERGAVVSSGE